MAPRTGHDPAPQPAGAPARRSPDGAFGCVAAAWHAHESELRGFLRHRLNDAQQADDVLQDVFVKAMREGRRFCELDNPRAWLFQVARNALVDRLRTQHPADPLDEESCGCVAPVAETPDPVDALAGCVARTLAELAPDDAEVLRACDIDGLTQREFAQRHGLSLPAVKSRLLRARQRLRERLTAACRVSFEPDGRVAGHVPRPPLAAASDEA